MAPFNQQFLSTFFRRQPFDLPDSMIYYILKNPSSSKVYQKMIQCCKYFFIKNPILVIHCLEIGDDGWKICSNQKNCDEDEFQQAIDNRIITSCSKLWIENQLRILSTDSNVASDLIPKTYQCEATLFFFENQKMSLHQFLFCAQSALKFGLDKVILSSDTDAEIPFEEIVANLPNITYIFFKYHPDSKNASSDTVKKLLQIPHFHQITKLCVYNASEKFNIDPIYELYKKNRSGFTFGVHYQRGLSEIMAKKLDGIAKEILEYKFHESETPIVGHPEQSYDDYHGLWNLRFKSLSSVR